MKMQYKGSLPTTITTLGVEVSPGDVIDVPDDFKNVHFVPYVSRRKDAPDVKEEDKEVNE